ncbi:MAG: hypothetical protein ACHQK9_12880 [Reyranellales bacterium]
MALFWSIFPEDEMVEVSGEGIITRADIEDYLAAMSRDGIKSYAKLVEVVLTGTLALDRDDVEHVAQSLVEYGRDGEAGPVAIVVHSELHLDMAVLLKRRVGDRPFRIFTSLMEARAWLGSYGKHDHVMVAASRLDRRGSWRIEWSRTPGKR